MTTTTLTGRFDASSLAKNYSFAFVIIDDEYDNDVYVSAEDTLNAYHGDTVEVELTSAHAGKRNGKIIKIVQRNKHKFIGTLERVHKKTYFRCDNLKIHTLFDVSDDQGTPKNHKVQVEVINWGIRQKNRLPICKVTEILGICGEPEVEVLSVIRDFDLPLEFPEDVIEAANQFSPVLSPQEIARRKDLRDLYTITIDPISARDFDDAISLIQQPNGDKHLYVHIADVSHYVLLNGVIYNEAVKRGNSYYFPKKVIPMLPEILSNNLCSLRPREDKYTMTCLTIFAKSGVIKHQEVFESAICSDIRLSYEEVDEYFEGKATAFSVELKEVIDIMRELSTTLSLSRCQRGYLRFDMPEVNYIYDDEGYIKEIVRTQETESHILIENFMLIANEYVSKYLTHQARATMFRIHEDPDPSDFNKIADMFRAYDIPFAKSDNINKTWQLLLDCLPDERHHRVFDRMILRSMKKAKYSVVNKGHFGLGLQTYTHFTSPIRRLCDLLVHIELKSVLAGRHSPLSPEMLFSLAKVSNDKELIADESERVMERKVIASFMKGRIGDTFQAIITSMNNSTIFVELDDIPVKGVIKLKSLNDYYVFDERNYTVKGRRKGRTFRLCDAIKVIVIGVTDDVYFDIFTQSRVVRSPSRQLRKRGHNLH